MNKFYFTALKAGVYQIVQNNELYANINKHYFLAANGKRWCRGYDVVNRNGEVEHFKNLNAIHLKYKFANYPGYGRILRPI